MEKLIHKERFYQLCDQYGIDHPATYVYHKGEGHGFPCPSPAPCGQARRERTYWITP